MSPRKLTSSELQPDFVNSNKVAVDYLRISTDYAMTVGSAVCEGWLRCIINYAMTILRQYASYEAEVSRLLTRL